MKDNPKLWLYGPHWQGQRCEAKTRGGTLCQRPGNKINGRCRLHGGRSTGPISGWYYSYHYFKTIHGRFIKAEREKAKLRAKVGRLISAEVKKIEEWALDHGHLSKNWRGQLK